MDVGSVPPNVTSPPSAPSSSAPSPSRKKLYESPLFLISCVVLVVAFTILFLPLVLKGQSPEQITQVENITPPLTLTVESPTDETIATDDIVMVKGKTLPNVTVAYYTDTTDGTVESDAQGNFEGAIALANGINTLTITTFSDSGEEKSVVMSIVYDSQTQANAR